MSFRPAAAVDMVLGEVDTPCLILDLDAFDVIVDSSEVGARKPEPEIYRTATAAFGVAPAEIVYLDDFIQNVEGARREGWEVIHVRSEVQALDELNALVGMP